MRLVILDRDGVINQDSDDHVNSASEWIPLTGSLEAIADLTRAGFTLAVGTNQSGIARGYLDEAELGRIHAKLLEEVERAGGRIAHIAWCPHGPADGCECRKPRPGLIDQILAALEVPDDAERWIVGDRLRDLEAGVARGCRPVLVRTGNGEATLNDSATRLPEGCLIVRDLWAFAAIACSDVGDLASDG